MDPIILTYEQSLPFHMRGLLLFCIVFSFCVTTYASVSPIHGIANVCLGGHKVYTDSTVGGSWASSNSAVASIDSSGNVAGLAVGTATISYIVGSEYTTLNIAVGAHPDVYSITGGGSCCAGSTGVPIGIDGSQAGVLYYLYKVTPGGGIEVGGGAGPGGVLSLGSVATAGTYYIIAVNASSHCASQMNGYVTVAVKPQPSLPTGPAKVCAGASIVLADSTAGGTWVSPNHAILSVDSISGAVTGLSGGMGIVSYVLPTGCYRTKTLTVLPIEIPAITYNAAANTLYAPPGYASYQWYDSLQGLIPGATAPSVAALYHEYYYVTVSGGNGCSRSSPLYHFDGSTGIEGSLGVYKNISFSPNPARDKLTVTCPSPVNTMTIYDMNGRAVLQQKNDNAQTTVDIGTLPNGLYIVRVNGQPVGNFIKQ